MVETVRKTGLDTAISAALAPWRKQRAVHDPGKVLLDLALAVALGGDCLSDVAVLRAEPQLFGPVASDPTLWRTLKEMMTMMTMTSSSCTSICLFLSFYCTFADSLRGGL